ncbi:MAG: hypothetical protein J6B53_14595 [Clostridia bacterium]|nr:hypothetical protein [Clostridia bacterium]
MDVFHFMFLSFKRQAFRKRVSRKTDTGAVERFNIRDDRKPENYPFPSIINTNNPPEKQGSATLFWKKSVECGNRAVIPFYGEAALGQADSCGQMHLNQSSSGTKISAKEIESLPKMKYHLCMQEPFLNPL